MLDAMFENRIALSDAGTGIGKTYAYLTAAIVYSHSRLVDGLPFQPVIIATSSIALQNAIVREYPPDREAPAAYAGSCPDYGTGRSYLRPLCRLRHDSSGCSQGRL